jgi:hypothetical protein
MLLPACVLKRSSVIAVSLQYQTTEGHMESTTIHTCPYHLPENLQPPIVSLNTAQL